jgi:hypothetical protein
MILYNYNIKTINGINATRTIFRIACEPPFFGADCASKCECDVGATSCDPVRGCVCGAGWTGTNCETDVNECDTPGTCTDTDKECVNIVGSYKCSCLAGYKADENGQCVGKTTALYIYVNRNLHKI